MNTKKILLFSVIIGVMLPSSIRPSMQDRQRDGFGSLNLMPVPRNIEFREGRFLITPDFKVFSSPSPETRIERGVSRLLKRLSQRTGFRFSEYRIIENQSPMESGMEIVYKRPGKLIAREDESYHLRIQPGRILLSAETDIGILRGIETLLQLFQTDRSSYYLPSLDIRDTPRFTWRGLLIDSCRHFIPAEIIKRNLDGMCAVKMNVFHWHLSDDQGFRVECKTFPRLHEAGSDGLFYSQDQIREIIGYASDRGIRVIPEFDIPGHSTSWLVGYPELASQPGPYEIERKYGVFDPCFNPAKEETYAFFDRFFSEMAALFPDEYIHIGGDEVNGKQWNANPRIQEFMKKNRIPDNHSLQAYFNRRISSILRKHEKKMMGWEQILQPGLPEGTIIQGYLGDETVIKATRMGYPVVNSKADEMYIDLLHPTEFHYRFQPFPGDFSTEGNGQELILGSEATMWGELVSPETIDSRIWPRTAAIAERLWSAPDRVDIEDMYRRLEIISPQLEEHGLCHIKNQAVLLRRLTRGANPCPLKILVDTLRPIILYDRPDWENRYTQCTPLTRLVDAAIPDPRLSREFQKNMDRLLDNHHSGSLKQVKKQLMIWKNNHDSLKPIIDQSPVLSEIHSLSRSLSRIASIGLEALTLLDREKNVDKIWIEEQMIFLKKAQEPQADLEFLVISPVEKLLQHLVQ